MQRRLTRISVHRTSLTAAVMYALMVFIIGILLAILGTPIAALAGSIAGDSAVGVGVWLAISVGFATVGAIAYGVFGYVFTALTALIYNIVSGWTGGVEFTLSE